MTQQVRKGYRNHRKASWALVIALAALIAAVVIPIASGASDKNYTLVFPSSGATTPAAEAASPGNQTICLGTPSYSATLTLTNTAKSVNLGSANITFPANVTLSGTPSIVSAASGYTVPASATATRSGSVVSLRNLSLTNRNNANALNVTVGLSGVSAALPQPRNITAVVKQANDFNDTSGGANTFEVPTFPSITVQACTVKIEGLVYRDSDGNGTGDSILTTAHSVTVSGSSTQTSSTDGNGKYSFTVPRGGSYTVCMGAASGEVQTKPTSPTVCQSNTRGGYSFTNLTSDSTTGNDFAFAGGVTATCDSAEPFESQFDSGNQTVVARFSSVGGTCKIAGKQFVFTTYDEGSSRVAKLSPVGTLTPNDCVPGTGVGCQIVVQRITWSLTSTSPELKTLSYDDAPYGAAGVLKFCLKDPIDRSSGSDGVTLRADAGAPSAILPSASETSCLIKTTQGPGPSPKRVDEVYSAYDGKISFG